jgi:hypothetical protein
MTSGTYIEELQTAVQAPSVKQQPAAIRMLFNWLVTGQIVPNDPAAAERGPEHVVKTGKTSVHQADAFQIDPEPRRCAISATRR